MNNKQRHNDSLYGPNQVGGLVFATVQCPIFDPQPGGNFAFTGEGNARLEASKRPFDHFNPLSDSGFVYVVNVLALPAYALSIDYTMTEDGWNGKNWTNLLRIGKDILALEHSVGGFIQRVVTRVRLSTAINQGWTADARKYIMKVSTPAFGQVVPDESIAEPVYMPAQDAESKNALKDIARESMNRTKDWDSRTLKDAPR